MTEYAKYDSDSGWWMNNARLVKDPEVRETKNGNMVRLTVVSSSRREGNEDIFVEVNVGDFHVDVAAYLKKGDILTRVEGKDFLRPFGDKGLKSYGIDRAKVVFPPTLKAELKTRGWTPGGGAPASDKPASKPAAGAKRPRPRTVQEMPED